MRKGNDTPLLISQLNMKHITLEGICAAIILNLSNPFLQIFGRRLGADDFQVALINGLPPLVAVLVLIPCAIALEGVRRRKRITAVMIALSGAFYLLVALVPFADMSVRAWLFVILIGLTNWPMALYNTSWQSFFSDTFDAGESNNVYAIRSKFSSFFGFITVLLTGLALTYLPSDEAGRIVVYQCFFAFAFVVSIVQIIFLSRVNKQQDAIESHGSGCTGAFSKEEFKQLLRRKPFVFFAVCAFIFYVSWQTAWPVFFIYYTDYTHANEFHLSLFTVASSIACFFSYALWNKLASKKGNSLVITIGAFGLSFNCLFFFRLWDLPILIAYNVLSGLFVAAFNLTVFTNLLDTLPEERKTVYISVFNTLINISGFISPLIGVWLYHQIGIFPTFMVLGIFRLVATGLFLIRHLTIKKRLQAQPQNQKP